jgi:hypothetical protein
MKTETIITVIEMSAYRALEAKVEMFAKIVTAHAEPGYLKFEALVSERDQLVKADCDHEALRFSVSSKGAEGVCQHCGAKLKAKWEVYE